jgi:hypothetical protein
MAFLLGPTILTYLQFPGEPALKKKVLPLLQFLDIYEMIFFKWTVLEN